MAIFFFSQNVKLDSLKKYVDLKEDKNIIITTHFLFENERKFLESLFINIDFYTFADFLSDTEMEKIDLESYSSSSIPYEEYLKNIKKKKNILVISKVVSQFQQGKRYIFSDDLGIELKAWERMGFKFLECDYYYHSETLTFKQKIKLRLKKIRLLRKLKSLVVKSTFIHQPNEVSVAYYKGHKYVFLGKMNRIDYRLSIPFKPSEEECHRLNKGEFETKQFCTYMTTWHEHGKCNVPDEDKYEVRWAQDGYLPPNYSHKDYFFKPKNVKYFCWDILGTQLFKNQGLPYEMIPFRNKLYLPEPKFPMNVKNVLIVASGSGDWTALKNRSDDDIMVDAFVQMARRFPNIHFVYRCHPTWIHPQNVGVNAINRVHNYFEWLRLKNLTLSSNMPIPDDGKEFRFSFSRSTLDEDLTTADFVFGEHSISMIDAAFKGIPFSSVNLTKRRNFFVGINDLGFPSCSTIDDIASMIDLANTAEFKNTYLKAVKNYNNMTKTDK